MAWYKAKYNETYSYGLQASSMITRVHRSSEISLDALNDATRQFDFYQSAVFIREYVSVTNKKDIVCLPDGVYTGISVDDSSRCKLVPYEIINKLGLLNLEANNIINNDFETFINSKKIYRMVGNKTYKKGILLYGPPGTGKTLAIQKVLTSLAPKKSITLFLNAIPCNDLLDNLAEDPRLKIIVFEELCGVLNEEGITSLLTFLDGETSLENCYIVASTNYPEKLPSNLTNRPGRFDALYEIGPLSANDRKSVLNYYYKNPTEEEIKLTKDMTVVQVTEVILLIRRDKLTFKEAVQKLRNHEELAKTKFSKQIKECDLDKGIL